jgi:hypothetical protein
LGELCKRLRVSGGFKNLFLPERPFEPDPDNAGEGNKMK